ncbi:hypothetical protein [Nocardia alni]|uniref:hypothetical protein n=1 Tax=Nocardia alni TaxID=2815723 RepID=UPI001C22CA23|nr:hypothetical protein [Nocardia alni]
MVSDTWVSADQMRAVAAEPLTIPVLAVGCEKSLGEQMIGFVRESAPRAWFCPEPDVWMWYRWMGDLLGGR